MKAKNKERYSFSKSLSQNFEVLPPRGDAINPKMGQKGQNGSFTNIDRKVKIKSKSYFEVNYSFMKPFSQNFEDLTQRHHRHQPKISLKNGPKLYLMY